MKLAINCGLVHGRAVLSGAEHNGPVQGSLGI